MLHFQKKGGQMRICVPGGAGYVGSRLVPELLALGHEVIVLDLFLYGSEFKESKNLTLVKADVRDLQTVDKVLAGCDAVIYLACISNDPSFELNPTLGKSINLDAFEPFVKLAVKHKIGRFIYASSSSVYGIKQEENVVEDMSLEPLTDYSRFKAECETILFKYLSDEFCCTVVRPATVCGYAPRQRLDVVVNILTNLAYHTGKVKVMGGPQMRPNIHIEDMVRSYLLILESPVEKIQGEIFNVGCHNHTVLDLGKMVQSIVGEKREIELVVETTNDPRSYHISSEKIEKVLGFTTQFTVQDAVSDLVQAFEAGKLPDAMNDIRYFNIKTMQAVNLT